MRRLKLTALLFASASILATTAFAQPYPGSRDRYGRGPYSDRDPYYRDSYGNRGGYYRGDPVNVALQNLRRAASTNRYDRHERNHFEKAIRDLNKFQDRARSGRFDSGALGSAISHMQDLAQARQIHPRDRNLIARDISELRSLHASGGRYYDPYGRDRYSYR